MTNPIIHVGDVGTVFRLTIVETDGVTPIPIQTATIKNILFKKSNGTKVTKSATFVTDGSDGLIQYIGLAGDIDVSGPWWMQGYIEMPSGKFYSSEVPFTVLKNIS